MSFFRYPGGKSKLKGPIIDKISEIAQTTQPFGVYVEPFFGGGSICLESMDKPCFSNVNKIILADVDKSLVELWNMVIHNPDTIIERIKSFTPTAEDFYAFKEKLSDPEVVKYLDPSDAGFMKLAIHQMSYSGLGVKAGGPIGGAAQESEYDVACRWSPDSMIKKIKKFSKLLNDRNARIYPVDFRHAMNSATQELIRNPFVYLDPPYYEKGNDLYVHGFTENDHKRLADQLKIAKYKWLLSYDDCPEVRELYSWATIEEINVNYTIRTARAKSELLIYP